MQTKDLRDLVRFSEEGPHHGPLFESPRLWSEVLCLEGPQRLGPISDPGSDAICAVLAGEVAVQVDRRRARLKQWGTVLVPAGSALTIANASPDPAVLLIVAAPPPAPRNAPG
ncbi:MAG TPA: hypothetical protein VNO79_14060 [Actinomycetota bacterium]|nr:hypothetical protein [Actinomycetota bacterium]